MASGEWALTAGPDAVYWTADHRPYWLTNKGNQSFVPPIVAIQSQDPKLQAWALTMGATPTNPSGPMPGASYLKERGYWDSRTGRVKQGVNWNNIMATAVGGLIGAGAASAIAGSAGSAGSGASGASGAAGAQAATPAAGLHTAVPGAVASQGASASVPLTAGASGGVLPSSVIGGLHEAIPADIASQGASTGAGMVPPAPSFGHAAAQAAKGLIPKDASDVARLAALSAAVGRMVGGSGNQNPFDTPDTQALMALQRKRIEQTGPAFDTLVNMAYGMSPTRYRGAAPEGYPGDEPISGAYQYTGPRFG